ncbi:MAG: carbon-nitrogen hydrolase family protein [Candidatus Eisenbacteria bacterium]|uniref:Carbon-nitrogen hydrolase family protein n=1 Tax=Eiseniibacteriota bacterium TaxID=2212470 RepID=A0A956M0Z9_UNCEI|nr:carbon-nitrogen hydrolase family protein [Candidatus Eisenbacteria bacterium]
MTPFAIAGMQLPISGIQDNLPHLGARLDYLMHLFPWVQMVVFSELASYGPSPAHAQPLPGPAERTFQEMAARYRLWLVNGSMFEMHEGKIYNTSSVIDPAGRVIGRYRKMFPFRPYEAGVESGTEPLVFDIPDVGRFAVTICYDMWFPETTRAVACQGAEVILHPSLTTTIDREVELSIARASAAMNQCFFLDINGVGDGGNGRSVIVGPAGDVLYQAGTSEEIIPLEIDLDRVRRSREIGLRGLGQPLKSFRDHPAPFDFYARVPESEYLGKLGPLVIPQRGSRAGLPDTDKGTRRTTPSAKTKGASS